MGLVLLPVAALAVAALVVLAALVAPRAATLVERRRRRSVHLAAVPLAYGYGSLGSRATLPLLELPALEPVDEVSIAARRLIPEAPVLEAPGLVQKPQR